MFRHHLEPILTDFEDFNLTDADPLYLRLVSGVCFHISPNLTKSKWLTRANFSERASFVSVYVLVTEQLTAFFAIIF